MHIFSDQKDTWWVEQYILNLTISKMFPRCAPKNVELIGSPIGGSTDLEIGAHTSWLSQTLCNFLMLFVKGLQLTHQSGYHKQFVTCKNLSGLTRMNLILHTLSSER